MPRDLHIFGDLQSYRLFRDGGGEGLCLFRDPLGEGLRSDDIYGLEVRDIYLHNGVMLTVHEMQLLRSRQRHTLSRAIYGVYDAY